MILIRMSIFFVSFAYCEETSSDTININISTDDYRVKIYQKIELLKNEIEPIDISSSNFRVIDAILDETTDKIKYFKDHSNLDKKEKDCEKALLKIRKALIKYFILTNRYPKNLEELVPYFTDYIPEINIHGNYDSRIKYISDRKFDKNYENAIDRSSEYIYFSDPQSVYWGFIILNSDRE